MLKNIIWRFSIAALRGRSPMTKFWHQKICFMEDQMHHQHLGLYAKARASQENSFSIIQSQAAANGRFEGANSHPKTAKSWQRSMSAHLWSCVRAWLSIWAVIQSCILTRALTAAAVTACLVADGLLSKFWCHFCCSFILSFNFFCRHQSHVKIYILCVDACVLHAFYFGQICFRSSAPF